MSGGLGTFVGHWLAPAQVRRRRLRAARSVTVADARDGELVKLTGVVVAGRTLLRAPRTGRECVAFELDEYGNGVLVPRRECAAFSLAVGDSLVEIESSGAETVLRAEAGRVRPPKHEGLLEALEERVLGAGTTATVLGVARWRHTAGGTYREDGRQLVIEAPRGATVLVTDDPAAFDARRR